jgi:release factor glutamine methyltransferase
MNIASNSIKDIIRYFTSELLDIYEENELNSIIFIVFEHILGFSRADMMLKRMEHVNQSDLLKLNFICKRLKRNEPIQYILGEAIFYGMKFMVNRDVLIPRPETEELVDKIIKDYNSSDKNGIRIIDIGTGSGCIAIGLKKHLPFAEVYSFDVSAEALEVAKQNAEINKVSIQFIKGNILTYGAYVDIASPLFNELPMFDIIVSNPPYVTLSEAKEMEVRVKDFEPGIALFVGDKEPLLFYNAISEFASKKLKTGGKLYFELNSQYASDTMNLLKQKGFTDLELVQDISKRERILVGSKK